MTTFVPQPIETHYAGHRFRSRSESRWAVAFDALGEPWLYEPQGFVVSMPGDPTVRYLPDFYLPQRRLWVEVKGSNDSLAKDWDSLVMAAYAAYGLPADPEGTSIRSPGWAPRLLVLGPIPAPRPDPTTRAGFLLFAVRDEHLVVHHSDLLGNVTAPLIDFDSGQLDVCVPAGCLDLEGHDVDVVRVNVPARDRESSRIDYALTCARSARFEHGEQPVVVPWRVGEQRP